MHNEGLRDINMELKKRGSNPQRSQRSRNPKDYLGQSFFGFLSKELKTKSITLEPGFPCHFYIKQSDRTYRIHMVFFVKDNGMIGETASFDEGPSLVERVSVNKKWDVDELEEKYNFTQGINEDPQVPW